MYFYYGGFSLNEALAMLEDNPEVAADVDEIILMPPEREFFATGTVRENRLPGNTLMNSKNLKKEIRGTFDYQKISNQNIIAVKWNDNSIVTICSNYAGVEPLHVVKRYSRREKKIFRLCNHI